MKKFSEADNKKVAFLIRCLTLPARDELPLNLLFQYDDELFEYALQQHSEAERFYLSCDAFLSKIVPK